MNNQVKYDCDVVIIRSELGDGVSGVILAKNMASK